MPGGPGRTQSGLRLGDARNRHRTCSRPLRVPRPCQPDRTCVANLPPPAKPEYLERQVTLWLHHAGAKGILEGQGSAAAADAVQRAFEIGCQVKGRSFYGATALQCMMLCAHGRLAECQVIATGLRERYQQSGEPDIGLVSDFVDVMISAIRGDVDAAISTGRTHDGHLSPTRRRL